MRRALPIIILFLVSLLFFSWNISGQWYSLDEPETVIISHGVGLYGFPSGFDGRLFTVVNNGREFASHSSHYLWVWHAPFQGYLAFWGGLLFGRSVFGYRFLFTFFGAGTVVLFYLLADKLFRLRWLSIILSVQLMLNVPFFLYIRQVRYYAPSVFFATLLWWLTVVAWEKGWGKRESVIFGLGSLFLFLTNYIIWMSCTAVIGLIFLWRKNWQGLIISAAVTCIALSYYLYFQPYHSNPVDAYGRSVSLLTQFWRYFPYLNNYLLPFLFLPLLLFVKKNKEVLLLILGTILIKLGIYAVFLETHGRYLIDSIPLIILLYGWIYQLLVEQKKRWVVIPLFLSVICIINLGALFPKGLFPQRVTPLYAPTVYVSELTGTYPSFFVPLAAYLKKHAKVNDVFWSNSYRNSLMLLSGIPTFSAMCDLRTQTPLGPFSVTQKNKIRWVIFFHYDNRFPQDFINVPCFGKTWQKTFSKEFHQVSFELPSNVYLQNDPDIVSRSFPPVAAHADQIAVYERNRD